jgi:hypothetical protein
MAAVKPKLGKNTGNAGKGRPKGSPNKFNATLKDMILNALNDVGGQSYLAQQASMNPSAYMALLGKVLPMQITGADPNGNPSEIVIRVIKPDN